MPLAATGTEGRFDVEGDPARGRDLGPGGRAAPRHRPRPDRRRRGAAHRAQEGLPHPGRPHQGAQEGRPQGRAQACSSRRGRPASPGQAPVPPSRRLFGTDGVRGVANRDLTPELALAIGRPRLGPPAPRRGSYRPRHAAQRADAGGGARGRARQRRRRRRPRGRPADARGRRAGRRVRRGRRRGHQRLPQPLPGQRHQAVRARRLQARRRRGGGGRGRPRRRPRRAARGRPARRSPTGGGPRALRRVAAGAAAGRPRRPVDRGRLRQATAVTAPRSSSASAPG